MGLRIYVERSAKLKGLPRTDVKFLHFPYDAGSALPSGWVVASPSAARYIDLKGHPYSQFKQTRYCDFTASQKFERILEIVGSNDEVRVDALHIDSAYKSGCDAFLTTDKTDILKHRVALESLLGMRFFHPIEDRDKIDRFVAQSIA